MAEPYTVIQTRRDTEANWNSNDPVLALGEQGYDTTNNKIKVGDGSSEWSALSYLEAEVDYEGGEVPDLQDVTDVGSNTTNSITLDTDKIVLNADGSATFAKKITATEGYALAQLPSLP